MIIRSNLFEKLTNREFYFQPRRRQGEVTPKQECITKYIIHIQTVISKPYVDINRFEGSSPITSFFLLVR